MNDAPAMILRIEPEDFVIVGQAKRPVLSDLARLADEKRVPLVVDLGRNPLLDGLPTDGREVTSAKRALTDGAGLVIVRTDGFLGGPPGGLLLGQEKLVERIRQQPSAAAHRPNGITSAALAATLDLCRDCDQARFNVPLLSLLDTPLENLRTRAERLAPQMVGSGISSAEVVSLPETAIALPWACRLPSWGIALRPQTGQLAALKERLRQAVIPVEGRVEGEALLLDMRTVFPRQDINLVGAVTGS
jgi:L-seryl-tRNA(Ser) seleniumtransferase